MLWDNIVYVSVSMLIAVFCSLYVNKAGSFVDTVVNSCENGAPIRDGVCDCTGLPFTGKNCQTSTCVHGWGVYDLDTPHTMNRPDAESLWACYCTDKWSGYNCDKCNAEDECTGKCNEGYFGPHCQNTCFDNLTEFTRYSSDTPASTACADSEDNGGTCNYCSGNGTCNDAGTCQCNNGYFDYKSGNDVHGCSLECPKHNNTFCSGAGECASNDLTTSCNCRPGYAGEACQYACINQCSGIGTCVVAGNSAYCSCPDRTRGDHCQYTCPGLSVCSGRGTCGPTGNCTCIKDWEGEACNCQKNTTCSGHGSCQFNGTCACDTNWDCTVNKCVDGWYGSECLTPCTASGKCNGHGACDQSGDCKCDSGWAGSACNECEKDVFPKPGGPGSAEACLIYITEETCHHHGYPNHMYGKSSRFSGMCICHTHFDERSNCDRCVSNWYGDNCDQFCDDDECYKGRCSDRGKCICEDGWFGEKCDSSCGGDGVCSGHGTCVKDEWTSIHQKCRCDEGYVGMDCDISAPMSSGSICNGRGAAVVTQVDHTGITFPCTGDVHCGDFSGEIPDFTGSDMSVAMQTAFAQAVFGVLGPEQPYGPVCSLSKSPVSLIGTSGSVGEHAMTEWSLGDITDGPFYIDTPDGFVYPLFRTKRPGFIEEDATDIDGVVFYGDFTTKPTVQCEHLTENEAKLAGCTWLKTGFCDYAMQNIDAADWCYRQSEYEKNKCAAFVNSILCNVSDYVDTCDVQCNYTDSQKAIDQWNSKHIRTPFDGEDLINHAFVVTEDMYWGDNLTYDITKDCDTISKWDFPTRVYPSPRWWCQHGDTLSIVPHPESPSDHCQEIDKTVAGFEGFSVRGVQYDTFQEAVSNLNYRDTIVYGKNHEYAETMSIDDMCRYYNSSFEETWVSDGVGAFNGTYYSLEYSFTLANFSLGTTVAFVNETVYNTNNLAIRHGRRLQMKGKQVTTGPELELDTVYRIRLDFGDNVTCKDLEGFSCPAPVDVGSGLAGMRAVEGGGTHVFAMHAYKGNSFNDTVSKTDSWRLRMPPGWTADKSIWKLCKERHGVPVRSKSLCDELHALYTHDKSNLTRQETLDCVRRLEKEQGCGGRANFTEDCDKLGDIDDMSMCEDPGSNPTGYPACDSPAWKSWCDDMLDDKLPGKCALMQCECNMDTYLGIAGSACQLSCPVNSDTGTACGYQEPPEYPYGKCKEIPGTSTVTPSTCECTRSLSESCEEKCDDSNTPDCNPTYSTETMRSFDIWGFGSEVSYDHRLSLVSYQKCTEYLQHHPASKVVKYNRTGLCRWNNTDITWGSDTGHLIDTLVTSKEECKALNSKMGLYKTTTTGSAGANHSDGIVFADGIVMKPTGSVGSEDRLYDIEFLGDASKLDMIKGSKVVIGTVVTVHSPTQVWSSTDISDKKTLVYGGSNGVYTLNGRHDLWRFKTDVVVPRGALLHNKEVYETSNGYMYTLGKPTTGNIEVTLNVESNEIAGYILELDSPVESAWVNGSVTSYGNRIYSEQLQDVSSVTVWTGKMFTLTDVTDKSATRVEGDVTMKMGDKLGESMVVLDNVVTGDLGDLGDLGDQWYSSILKTEILTATTDGKICNVTCDNCTENIGMLLTHENSKENSKENSTGVIYNKIGTVFQIFTTDDWNGTCKNLTKITIGDPLVTKYTAELHQGSQKGEVWDGAGDTLTVVGDFTTGPCNFFQPAVTVSVIGIETHVVNATASVPVVGGIMQGSSAATVKATVQTEGTNILFESEQEWTNGLAVQGEITTVSCTASPVHLVKFESIYIVGSSEKILDPLNGSVDELHIVDYTDAKLTIEVDVAPVDTGLKVFTSTASTASAVSANVGDVARQGKIVGVVSNTDPLEIESSDIFDSGSITFGAPMEFDVTVTPANDILDIRDTVSDTWCSKINGVHVWGGDNLAQRPAQPTGTCDDTVLDYHPANGITGSGEGSGEGCSYSNTEIVRGSNIGNDIRALVKSKEECRGYLDYHPAVTLLDTGGSVCSFNDTHVSWGSDNIGTVMGMPNGTVRLGISQCQGGICMCKPPKNAYFYKSRTSITGRTVKIRQTKYFGRHKGTNFMQGPQPYLINHAKYNNEPITEENWEAMYDIWITSKSGFVCSNPTYAKLGEACDYNTICIDAVCGTEGTCVEGGTDKYTGDYKYEQCLVDSLLLSGRQDTSAYMGRLCQEECPSITEYGTPCSGHGTCSRSGACTCEVARTMVKYTQNTRQVIKNEDGKPLISFTGQDSLKMEERTGWRGDGCELMCPGYDAHEADMTGICSGHGQCTADAKCTCEIGYTGENCQLDCPNTKNLKVQCSGHGVCQPNTFKATSDIAVQLAELIKECTDTNTKEQLLKTITINGHAVSELQFYENVESNSTQYMYANGTVFNASKITPSIMLAVNEQYPVRIVGSDIVLVHAEFPRVGPNCTSTMVTNQYKIRPQINITRYNDEGGTSATSTCIENEEVEQTCDVMRNDTLQCAMCACPPTIYNGFWGGSDCRTCMPGYGGDHCKDSCPGFDGTDLRTACGGIGTCTWGSTNGEGTKFRTPTCTCGDDPDDDRGYKQCDLYVGGNQYVFYNTIETGECAIAMTKQECQDALTSIQSIDSTYIFEDSVSTPQGCSMSGKTVSYNPSSNSGCSATNKCMCKSEYNQDGQYKDGEYKTCSCKKGYSGFNCDQPTPTCLFGGTVAGLKCACTDGRLDGQQNCCPKGLKSTGVLATRELPSYITDSMVFTTWELMLDRTKEFAELCVANIPLPNNFIEIEHAHPGENSVLASNFGTDGCQKELVHNPALCKKKCIDEPTCNAVFVHATSGQCCYFNSWDNSELGGIPSTMCPSNYPFAYGGRSGYVDQDFKMGDVGKPGVYNRCCTEDKFFLNYDENAAQFTTTSLSEAARRWNAGYDDEYGGDLAEYTVGCYGKGGTESESVLTQYMTYNNVNVNNIGCKSPPCSDYVPLSVQGTFYIADGVTPLTQVWDYIARDTKPEFSECVHGNFIGGKCVCDPGWYNTFCSCNLGTPTTHKYINLTFGTCQSEGYQPIKTKEVCKAAAQALGITNGKDIDLTGAVDYPQDCYLYDGKLHFNPTVSVTPITTITDGQIICYNDMFMQDFTCSADGSTDGGCGDYRCACPAGKFGTTTCTDCPKGEYRGIYDDLYDDIYDEFPTECNKCPKGSYTSAKGSADCDICAAGKFQDQEGKDVCKQCTAGRYSNSIARTTVCSGCDAGQYQDESGTTSCKSNCEAGSSINDDRTACVDCTAGQFQDEDDQTGCIGCAAGKYQAATGQTSCTECQTGLYSVEISQVSCKGCEKGKHQDQKGQTSCKTCSLPFPRLTNDNSPAGMSYCVYGRQLAPNGYGGAKSEWYPYGYGSSSNQWHGRCIDGCRCTIPSCSGCPGGLGPNDPYQEYESYDENCCKYGWDGVKRVPTHLYSTEYKTVPDCKTAR